MDVTRHELLNTPRTVLWEGLGLLTKNKRPLSLLLEAAVIFMDQHSLCRAYFFSGFSKCTFSLPFLCVLSSSLFGTHRTWKEASWDPPSSSKSHHVKAEEISTPTDTQISMQKYQKCEKMRVIHHFLIYNSIVTDSKDFRIDEILDKEFKRVIFFLKP